jgi:hypothetical protein
MWHHLGIDGHPTNGRPTSQEDTRWTIPERGAKQTRTQRLAVLVTFLGITTVVTVIAATSAPEIAFAQGGSCPGDWGSQGITNCLTLPPPNNDTITNTIQPNGVWSSNFNSSSSLCVELYDDYRNAYGAGRVLIASMPTNTLGGVQRRRKPARDARHRHCNRQFWQ